MERPNWLYKKLQIDSKTLNILQQDLLKLVNLIAPDPEKFLGKFISEPNHDVIRRTCPRFYNFLRIKKIDTLLGRVGFLITRNDTPSVHSDYPETGYALNIPILNCDNTYTAWYQAEETDQKVLDYASDTWPTVALANFYNSGTAVEIDRIHANEPHWINILTPHAPICDHSDLRINCTLRFDELIYKYLIKEYGV
jgi:hypothetical protein